MLCDCGRAQRILLHVHGKGRFSSAALEPCSRASMSHRMASGLVVSSPMLLACLKAGNGPGNPRVTPPVLPRWAHPARATSTTRSTRNISIGRIICGRHPQDPLRVAANALTRRLLESIFALARSSPVIIHWCGTRHVHGRAWDNALRRPSGRVGHRFTRPPAPAPAPAAAPAPATSRLNLDLLFLE